MEEKYGVVETMDSLVLRLFTPGVETPFVKDEDDELVFCDFGHGLLCRFPGFPNRSIRRPRRTIPSTLRREITIPS